MTVSPWITLNLEEIIGVLGCDRFTVDNFNYPLVFGDSFLLDF